MTSNDDKKATKMTVAIGWGVVAGVLIKLIADNPKAFLVAGIVLIVLATIFLVSTLLSVLIDETFGLFKEKTENKLETIVGQASEIRERFEELTHKSYFVPKADLHEAIEAIELNDTSTALALLKAVVDKAGRDE